MESFRTTKFEAIGTEWQIDINETRSPEFIRGLFALVREKIENFEATYSRFRDDSLIDQIAHRSDTYTLEGDARELFDCYEKVYHATGGKVTPLIGNTLVDAGYDKHYSLKKGVLSPTPAWEEILDYHFPELRVKKPTQLDLGGLGKGHLIDIVGKQLEARGVCSYTIDAGGDIRHRSTEEVMLKVGLEHPEDGTKIIGTIEIGNKSICGSSGNRRAWSDMHHIIDPHTSISPTNISALWVTAETTLVADAMTTALFFTDAKILQKEFAFEYLIMHKDASITHSHGFTATIFSAS
jgi:thiamine biosynthesis lipoprotein